MITLREGLVKVRRNHDCFGCYAKIPKGTKADIQVRAYDGKLFTLYLCKKCKEKHLKMCPEDEFSAGDLMDYERFPEEVISAKIKRENKRTVNNDKR